MKGKKPDHGRGTALAASPETQGTQIKGRLWLERSGETFISWGRVVLLENPDSGRVEYRDGGRILAADLARRRRITLVLPSTGIFNTTVAKNVAYGLKIRGISRAESEVRVNDALAAVGLSQKKWHRTSELSSGETKRLGIARAMVCNPEILMLDEPTANIDLANTAIIESIILKMKQERSATILMITHDPAQAERLGDDLLFMQDGKIIPA